MAKAVYKSGDKEYVIQPEDRIWLARMIYGEAGASPSIEEMRAVLWALMNRFMLIPAQREKSSLVDMIRAFSQPINPCWDGEGEGDFCVLGGKYYGTKYCSASKLERRRRVTSMPWEQIPAKIRGAVLAFEKGDLSYPQKAGSQRITNWASYEGVEDKFPWGVNIGGNWFFEDKAAMNYTVAALTGMSTAGKVIGVLAVGGIAAALGSFLAGKV